MKTDRDIQTGHIAHAINGTLLHTKVEVVGGGRKGPFAVVVERLGRRQMEAVVDAILATLGQERRPADQETSD